MEIDQSSLPVLISIKENPRVPPITYINSDKLVIGRGHEATFKIIEKAISRKHCTLEKVSSFGWKITAYSRNAVDINGTPLSMDQSRTLKCGDKINLAGVCLLLFKCSPNQNQKCCCDVIQEDIEMVELIKENSQENQENCVSISPVLPTSTSFELSKGTPAVTQCNLPNTDDSSTSSTLKKERDLTAHCSYNSRSLPKFSNLEEKVRKYKNEMTESSHSDKKKIDVLEENLSYLKQLYEFNEKFNEYTAISGSVLLPTAKRLLRFCKENYRSMTLSNLLETGDIGLNDLTSKVNTLLIDSMRCFMYNIPDLLDHSIHSNDTSSHNYKPDDQKDEKKEISILSAPKIDTVEKESTDSGSKLKDELKNYKQNSEWQEARIQYLEMKLKERDKMEKELETAKEDNEILESQLGEMRLKLSKLEVIELELSYLKETTKYKEDDKRNKDELEKQIATLKTNISEAREEVEKITMAKSSFESENMNLKQKCEELQKKLNAKVGCSRNETTGEYCCEFVACLRDNVLESLEKEFTCCICNEMFIEATVTNCNHVFCAFCLKEWKKKKMQCPFCRAAVMNEHRANVIDECITNIVKLISDKLYAERLQMIEDRKNTGTPPLAKRARRGRNAGGQHAQVPVRGRNHPYNFQAQISPFAPVIDLINLN